MTFRGPKPFLTPAVPVDDALAEMYGVMSELYGENHSQAVEISSVETVKGSRLRTATRSSDASWVEDAFYLVNFGNDEGYAILGADPQLPPVIAIVEQGTISAADFDVYAYPSATRSGGDGILTLDQLWDPEDEEYMLPSDNSGFIIQLMTHFYFDVKTPEEDTNIPSCYYEYTPWTPSETYTGALMTTKWYQGWPFNSKCPEKSGGSAAHKGHAPAGCVAVAIAQIVAHNERSTAKHTYGVSSTWAELKAYDFWGRSDISRFNSAFDIRMREDIATIMSSIGSECGMMYTKKWSFATPNKAKKYFKNVVGYRNVDKYESYKEEKIISCLEKGYPVFMGAIDNFASGHAWVIDGYMKQTRKKIARYFNGTSMTTYENRKLMHCNFGWEGTADGYYLSKVFDTSKGPIEVAPVDPFGTGSTSDWDTDWWWRTVVYDL